MKARLVSFVLAGLLTATVASAQSTKEEVRDRKAVEKYTREQLNQKATKDARKEAKGYEKEGWTVTPGALPIEKQLDKAYMMQYETDDYGYPKYIMGEAMSIGENYDAAKFQAQELAKQNLAGQIQTEITTLIDNSLANKQLSEGEAASLAETVAAGKTKQLSEGEAASLAETVAAGKTLISQSIGRTIPLVEMYRTLKNKNKEVLVRIAYNSEMAKEAAKNALRGELEKKSEDLHKKLEQILSGK